MAERLMAKLDRLGAEAGIKQMTPEIYKFSQLLNDDKLKQWDEWRSKRTWVGLTDDELLHIGVATGLERAAVEMISNKLKEKNT